MHTILSAYLFQYKTCPLPGLGTLVINNSPAEYDFVNKLFLPPEPQTIFNTAETDAAELVDYIAAKQQCSVIAAIETLGNYCNRIKYELSINGKAVINTAGTLVNDADGTVKFEQNMLPAYLQQPVEAERVIHPEAMHTMLVGDKETTNVQMTEYYTESPAAKNYWWVWALVIFITAIIGLLVYFNHSLFSSAFGNINPVN
jgi:CCDC81-like prokaryotic HU domain 1